MSVRKLFFKILSKLTLYYYFQRNEKNTLLILMFHQVNDKKSLFYPAMPVSAFKDLCEFIQRNYTVIHLSEIKSHFSTTNKPAVVISIDDGHYDILENIFPILSKLGLPFNVNIDTEILETGKPQDFVRVYDILNQSNITTYLNSKFMNKPIVIDRQNPMNTEKEFTSLLSNLTAQQKREVTDDLSVKAGVENNSFSKMLSEQDIIFLSQQNVEFGSHSHTHSILTNLKTEQIEYELSHSKQILENIIRKKIEVLAYPNGIHNEETDRIAKKTGYTTLLETDDLINHIKSDSNSVNSYKRVNQYHQTVDEALAHTYGITEIVKKFKG